MKFDLNFDQAIQIIRNKSGWVQGEKFNKDEYLSYDVRRDCFVKNTVESSIGWVVDGCSSQTREIWDNAEQMNEELKNQKYRIILILNKSAVYGTGIYSNGFVYS